MEVRLSSLESRVTKDVCMCLCWWMSIALDRVFACVCGEEGVSMRVCVCLCGRGGSGSVDTSCLFEKGVVGECKKRNS